MPTIKCYQFDNTEQEARAKELIEPLMQYFPAWVLEIGVSARPFEDTELLSIYLMPRYKRINFRFGPAFWTYDIEEQRLDVMHEFFHAVLGELIDWIRVSVLDPMKEKDETVFNILDREFTDRSERVTQELAHLFGRLLGDAAYGTYGTGGTPARRAFKITDTTQERNDDKVSREKGGTNHEQGRLI